MEKHHGAQSKICPSCEKPFTNRKKWSSRGIWPQIVYCSRRCATSKKNKSHKKSGYSTK